MPGYKPQVKTNSGMVDIPIAATYDENGDNIVATYATKSELAAAGQFDPNGTYPNLTAGEATHAQSADSATNATNANYATSAGSASTATNATHATSADSATNDAQGRNIASTYALKSEVGVRVYTHYITISAISGIVGSQNNKDCHATCMIEYKSTRSSKYTWDAFCQELYNQGIVGTDSGDDSILFKASGFFVKDSADVIYEIIGICVYKQNRDYWITARQMQARGAYYNLSIRESDGDVTEFIDIVV